MFQQPIGARKAETGILPVDNAKLFGAGAIVGDIDVFIAPIGIEGTGFVHRANGGNGDQCGLLVIDIGFLRHLEDVFVSF